MKTRTRLSVVCGVWILLLQSVSAPASAQLNTYQLQLPALYRQIPVLSGEVLTVTSMREAPELKLATVGRIGAARMDYDLLLSRDGGLSWGPAAAQPWQGLGPAPMYRWGDMLSPRILLLHGVVTLVVLPAWVSPPVLYMSQDYGRTWTLRALPATAGCTTLQVSQLATTPAAPDRLLLSGRCVNGASNVPGMFASYDAGLTWSMLDPWTPAQPEWPGDPAGSATQADLLYRSIRWNWQRTRDLARTWENLSIPGEKLWISPNDDQILVTVGPSLGLGLSSTDGGLTWRSWRRLPCPGALSDFIGPVWLRGATETLIAACVGGPLIRSMDFGQNWVTVPLPEGQLGSLLVADDAVAKGIYVEMSESYGSNRYRLYRSVNSGDTWQDVAILAGP